MWTHLIHIWKIIGLEASSLSILTAINLNPFPQFLQLTITTIIEAANMVILLKFSFIRYV